MLYEWLARNRHERQVVVDDGREQPNVGGFVAVAVGNRQQTFAHFKTQPCAVGLRLEIGRDLQSSFGQRDAGLLNDIEAVLAAQIV